jgi:hypothetical protein
MRTDWVGEVFSARRDCGEDISIVYGQKIASSPHAEPRWFELPHNEFDGIGGLATLLRRQCYPVGALPVLRGDRFGFWRALRGLFTVLPTLRLRRRQWRQFDGTREVRQMPVTERLAWRLFTEEETKRIAAAAKAAGVTVNTYLLFHLDAAVACQLTSPASDRRWMIPVNLRGAVTRDVEAAPHMSFLTVDLDQTASLSALQGQISQLKHRGYHWGAWLALNAGRLIGREAMRRDMRNKERQNHGWTGIFSNLGVWRVPGSGPWIFCPAISRVHPVGAGCITMNGRMALAIQLHEGFGADLRTSYHLLEEWRRCCLPESSSQESNIRRLLVGAVG